MTWLPFTPSRPTHWFAGPVSLCGTLARPPGEPTAGPVRECRLCRSLLERGLTRPQRAAQMPEWTQAVPFPDGGIAILAHPTEFRMVPSRPDNAVRLVPRGTFPANGFRIGEKR